MEYKAPNLGTLVDWWPIKYGGAEEENTLIIANLLYLERRSAIIKVLSYWAPCTMSMDEEECIYSKRLKDEECVEWAQEVYPDLA